MKVIKRKILSLMLVFIILSSLFVACVSAENADTQLRLNYESNLGDVQYVSTAAEGAATGAWVQNGANGSNGAMQITTTSRLYSPAYSIDLRVGQSYKASAWIKMESPSTWTTFRFDFRDRSDSSHQFSQDVAGVSYTTGEWMYFEKIFTFEGLSSNGSHSMNGQVRAQIVCYSTGDDISNGNPAVYYIDDFEIVPIADKKELLLESFEEDLGNPWQWSLVSAERVEGGAEGSKGAARVTTTSRNFGLGYNMTLINGKRYKASVRIKMDRKLSTWSNMRFDFRDAADTTKQFYQDVTNVTYTPGEWMTFETEFTFEGKSSNGTYDMSGNVIAQIVCYKSGSDGIGADSPGSYLIDDFIVEPIVDGNNAEITISADVPMVREDLCIGLTSQEDIYGYYYSIQKGTDSPITIASGFSLGTVSYFPEQSDYGTQLNITVYAIDNDYHIVGVKSAVLGTVSGNPDIEVVFQQAAIHDDTEEISALINYDGIFNIEDLFLVLAQYDASGELLKAKSLSVPVEENGDSVLLSDDVAVGVSYAEIYCLDEASLKPLIEPAVIMRYVNALYVDPENGSDNNPGTIEHPFETVAQAQSFIRAINEDMQSDISVYLKAGEHSLQEPLVFDYRDSGNNGYKIVYRSYGDGRAILHSGEKVENWTPHDQEQGIYKAYVGTDVETRQFYVNGVRATRARSERLYGEDRGGTLANCVTTATGHTTTDTFLGDFAKPQDLEMVYTRLWTHSRCGVESITVNNGVAEIIMEQPAWDNLNSRPSTKPKAPYYYENAYELLDEPGEWYLSEGYIYYIPREFEDIETLNAVIPVGEKLVELSGEITDSISRPVENIEFNNISFQYTTWMRPSSENGHVDMQNNYIKTPSEDYLYNVADSAVLVKNAKNIDFRNCEFTRLGSSALNLLGSTQDCEIVGNEIFDVSGGGIQVGDPHYQNTYVLNQTKPQYVIKDHVISNNYIHHIGQEYKSASAISVTYPKDTIISQNEIYSTPYSGIHVGYIGTPTKSSALSNLVIEKNYIHDVMNDVLNDGGAIYLCSGTGRSANDNPIVIRDNYIEGMQNRVAAIYNDTGANGVAINNNVVDLGEETQVTNLYLDNRARSIHWLFWQDTCENIQCSVNYVAGAQSGSTGNTSQGLVYEAPTLYDDDNRTAAVQTIIDVAGPAQEYANKFLRGAQDVTITSNKFIRSGKCIIEPIQYEVVTSLQSSEEVKVGDVFNLTVLGRNGRNDALSSVEGTLYFSSRTPNIVSVGESGTVTALSAGTGLIDVYYLHNGVLTDYEVELFVSDSCEEFVLNTDYVHLLKGTKLVLNPQLKTEQGRYATATSVEYQVANSDYARIEDGKIVGVTAGETTLTATAYFDGSAINTTIPVKITEEGTPQVYDFTQAVADTDGWIKAQGSLEYTADGITIPASTGFTTYSAERFDKPVEMELLLPADRTGGINIAVGTTDLKQNQNQVEGCYYFAFSNNNVAVYRFNNSVSTLIFGGDSISGEGTLPCGFRYGVRHNLKIGTIPLETGTRIYAEVDGKKIVDYIDSEKQRIKGAGYICFSSSKGDAVLYNSKAN